MNYMMMIFESDDAMESRNGGPNTEAYWASWGAYHSALTEAGVITGGNALQGKQTATTLRITDGKRQVQDGPYADSKEQLGGYMVFDCPDLDTALDWAAKCPAAEYGAVEVRPVHKSE